MSTSLTDTVCNNTLKINKNNYYSSCIDKKDINLYLSHDYYNPVTSQKDFQNFMNQYAMNNIKCNEWESIIKQIEDLVQTSVNTLHAELEVHIGKVEYNKHFHSGVSKEWFEFQLQKLEKFQNWEGDDNRKTKDWERFEEYIFQKEIRMRRTPNGVSTFMKKTLIKGIDISMINSLYDIRIVLKSENRSHINYGVPRLFRFKETKSFRYGNFTYFLSKVYEGTSLDRISHIPKYEIELEWNGLESHPDHTNVSVSFLTKSMIMKCKGFIGENLSQQGQQSFQNQYRSTQYQNHPSQNRYHNPYQQNNTYYKQNFLKRGKIHNQENVYNTEYKKRKFSNYSGWMYQNKKPDNFTNQKTFTPNQLNCVPPPQQYHNTRSTLNPEWVSQYHTQNVEKFNNPNTTPWINMEKQINHGNKSPTYDPSFPTDTDIYSQSNVGSKSPTWDPNSK